MYINAANIALPGYPQPIVRTDMTAIRYSAYRSKKPSQIVFGQVEFEGQPN